MLRKNLIVLFILISVITSVVGQEVGVNRSVAEVLPPSPNAYAFSKFALLPTNTYTGAVSTDIPIWQLRGTELSHPISLSYHSGGIKVQEEASWVGLGWNLNVGGSITRIVKGLPDEYAQIKYDEVENMLDSLDSQSFLLDVNSQFCDPEPDIFTYNVAGQSGKFILYNGQVYFPSHRDVKVISYANGQSYTFEIIADNGTRYLFEAGGMEDIQYNDDGLRNFSSSWFVTKIISANGLDQINFEYTPEHIIDNKLVNQTLSIPYVHSSVVCGNLTISSNTTNTTTNTKRLVSVESSIQRIEFIAQANVRADLGTGSSNSRALDEIKINDRINGNVLKVFKFKYNPLNPLAANIGQ